MSGVDHSVRWQEIKRAKERTEEAVRSAHHNLVSTYGSEIAGLANRLRELPTLIQRLSVPPNEPWSALDNRDDLEDLMWAHQQAYNRQQHCHELLMQISVRCPRNERIQEAEREARQTLWDSYDALKLGEAMFYNLTHERPVDEGLDVDEPLNHMPLRTSRPVWFRPLPSSEPEPEPPSNGK